MAMRYGYFDSEITGVDSEGMPIFDRAETSELFRLLFAKLLTNGVLAKPADCFQVLAGDTGLTVKVRPGFGLINGAFAYDAAESTYELATAPTQYSRIDRVVLRVNYRDRLCEIIIKTGTAASSPVAPELIRPTSGDYYELSLATIRISTNMATVTQSAITDTRPDSSVCGYITQFIDSIDTEVFFAQFNAFYDEFVDKSDASYEEFLDMAQQAYDGYTDHREPQRVPAHEPERLQRLVCYSAGPSGRRRGRSSDQHHDRPRGTSHPGGVHGHPQRLLRTAQG